MANELNETKIVIEWVKHNAAWRKRFNAAMADVQSLPLAAARLRIMLMDDASAEDGMYAALVLLALARVDMAAVIAAVA